MRSSLSHLTSSWQARGRCRHRDSRWYHHPAIFRARHGCSITRWYFRYFGTDSAFGAKCKLFGPAPRQPEPLPNVVVVIRRSARRPQPTAGGKVLERLELHGETLDGSLAISPTVIPFADDSSLNWRFSARSAPRCHRLWQYSESQHLNSAMRLNSCFVSSPVASGSHATTMSPASSAYTAASSRSRLPIISGSADGGMPARAISCSSGEPPL